MPSFSRATTASAARTFTLLTTLAAMVHASSEHYAQLQKRVTTYEGCYSSSDPLVSAGTNIYQSAGSCQTSCDGSPVFAMTKGDACWCGDLLPALSDEVDKSECDTPCQGYPSDTCGGSNLWSVYTIQSGVENFGGNDTDSDSSTSTSSSSSSSSASQTTNTVVTSTNAGQTIIVTVPATAAASATNEVEPSSGGGGSNTAGIAAGVVVGVVVLAAIIAGVYFFLRRKKRIAAEEDFKQRTQVSDFMRGGDKHPPNTGYSGMSDARLDPEAGRRDSVGSLADNQDYSRRILRVANPSD